MNILNALLSYVLLYRYVTIAVVVYSASLILPLPANAMLLAVGAFASQGYFSFWAAFAVAIIANTLGDCTGYALALIYGERLIRLLRLHKFKFYNQLQEELRRDAVVTVFTSRFASSLSVVVNFLAGLVRVPARTFVPLDLIGNIIEPGIILTVGYLVGSYWDSFDGIIESVGAIIAVAVVMFILWRMYRRMVRRYEWE